MSTSKSSLGCMILFALPFAAVGVAMTGLIGHTVWQSSRMSAWPTVPATILEADLKVTSSSDGTSENAVARYRYQWDKQTFENDKVSLGKGGDNIGSFQKRKANTLKHALRNSQTVSVHVNPDNPVESILYPELRLEMIGFYALFALVFGGAGFGIIIGGIVSQRKKAARDELETRYPDQPWMVRQDWASGRLASGNTKAAWILTGFAVFWNLLSLPVLFAFPEEYFEKGNQGMLLALLFPLIGIGMIIVAGYLWARHRKYGGCELVLDTVPGVIGGPLNGTIRVPGRVETKNGFDVKLACVQRVVTGSGKNRSTRERELWTSRRHLDMRTPVSSNAETLIPVAFTIPFDCQPVDTSDSQNRILWRLEVEAETPGVDFKADFEPPVFSTPESDPAVTGDAGAKQWAEAATAEDGILWREEHIRVERSREGGTRLIFPMSRHKGMTIGLFLFSVIWWAITLLPPIYTDIPLLFPILFGLFGVLITGGFVTVAFKGHTIDMKPGQIRFRGGLFGGRTTHSFPVNQIQSLDLTTNSSQNGQAIYTLRLETVEGTRHALASQIKGRANADALRNSIQETIGLET